MPYAMFSLNSRFGFSNREGDVMDRKLVPKVSREAWIREQGTGERKPSPSGRDELPE